MDAAGKQLKNVLQVNLYLSNRAGNLYCLDMIKSFLLTGNSYLFFHAFVPLKLLTTETILQQGKPCDQAWSQNGLSLCLIFFLWGLLLPFLPVS